MPLGQKLVHEYGVHTNLSGCLRSTNSSICYPTTGLFKVRVNYCEGLEGFSWRNIHELRTVRLNCISFIVIANTHKILGSCELCGPPAKTCVDVLRSSDICWINDFCEKAWMLHTQEIKMTWLTDPGLKWNTSTNLMKSLEAFRKFFTLLRVCWRMFISTVCMKTPIKINYYHSPQ